MIPRDLLAILGFAAIGAVVPLVVEANTVLNFLVFALVVALAAQGWNLLGGYGGQYSFGHAAFFGTGAYVTAILQMRWGVNPYPSFAMGIGMGAAMGHQMAGVFQPQGQPGASPPPLPGGKSFFVAVNGQQQGPFDMGALSQRQQQGQLTRETLVWAQGMANWTPAGQVPDLAALFANAPPPLPPR